MLVGFRNSEHRVINSTRHKMFLFHLVMKTAREHG